MKKVINAKLLYRRTFLIIYDVISIIVASYLAILMRYEFDWNAIPSRFSGTINRFLPINVLLTIAIFYFFKLYSSLWAFAGETELQNLVFACIISAGLNGIGLHIMREGTQGVPKSYCFMYAFILIAMLFASRFSYRFLRSKKHKMMNRKNATRVMIIGAGDAGNSIIKEIVTSNFSTMTVACLIDDDKSKWGSYIQGVKVEGGRDKIKECASNARF